MDPVALDKDASRMPVPPCRMRFLYHSLHYYCTSDRSGDVHSKSQFPEPVLSTADLSICQRRLVLKRLTNDSLDALD